MPLICPICGFVYWSGACPECAPKCNRCKGTGLVDSGGVDPQSHGIDIPCECVKEEVMKDRDAWLQDAINAIEDFGIGHDLIEGVAALQAANDELLEACEKAKVFIEYAWHELEDGKAIFGDQFPHKEDAIKEINRLSEAIRKHKGEC